MPPSAAHASHPPASPTHLAPGLTAWRSVRDWLATHQGINTRAVRATGMLTVIVIGLCTVSGPSQATTRHHPVGKLQTHASTEAAPPAVQHAWRCPGAQGHRAYSQWPCEGGQRLDDLADPRTRAQRLASTDQIVREQALSRRMARDRQHLDKQAEGQTAISIGASAGDHARAAHGTPEQRAAELRRKHRKVLDPHAPVPIERCRPPRCFTAKSPKDKKVAS